MDLADVVGAFGALFIIAMCWLRTAMHYPRTGPGRRQLTPMGVGYFGAFLLLLVVGWFAAPPIVRGISAAPIMTPVFARVAWFLAVYYAFIPLHGALRARGRAVFTWR
jgi:hypothetical protein